MRALPSIAFKDFSGTAGDVTAKATKAGTVLTVRPFPSKVATPTQKVNRNALSKISRAYKDLTDEQMAAWEELAGRMKGISTFGEAASLTGHNAFVRLNGNRRMVSLPLLTDAPEFAADVPLVSCSKIWITQTKIILTGIQHQTDKYRLVIKMSKGVSTGISNGWGKMVIVAPGKEEDWGDANVTTLYNEVIGFAPAYGDKLFCELYWMDVTNGFTGEAYRTNEICITDQEAQQQGYQERKLFTTNEVVKSECPVDDIDLEFTTGSNVFAMDAICHGSEDTNGYDIVLNKSLGFSSKDRFWTMGRAADGTHFFPQAYYGWFIADSSKTHMYADRTGGEGATKVELFGPCIYYR